MNVKKFLASNSREALRQVKDSLGPDAVILSNRRVADGVEIMALASDDISSMTSRPANPAARSGGDAKASREEARKPGAAGAMAESIISEIKSMRDVLEEQMAGLAWGDLQRREPAKAKTLGTMLTVGFSPALSRQLLAKMPVGLDAEQSLKWVQATLVRNLHTIPNENDILDRGGVYAVVGPTGVGKTTTAAKLAARYVVRHGAQRLALITTDGYRIGAHEQLRIYGKILGVPVHAVKDTEDLRHTLGELRNKHMVLIDTVGMSQRDRMVAEQAAMLNGCGGGVKRLLLLNATSNGDTLEDVVRAYLGEGLVGCVLTKDDEAASSGTALDVIIRNKLTLYYVANGQRVPEDLHLANRQYLMHRAFKSARRSSAYELHDAEFPVLMAGAGDKFAAPALNLPGGAHLG